MSVVVDDWEGRLGGFEAEADFVSKGTNSDGDLSANGCETGELRLEAPAPVQNGRSNAVWTFSSLSKSAERPAATAGISSKLTEGRTTTA
jgi:hypothetical protein